MSVVDARRALIFDADGVVIEPWGFATALENGHGIPPRATVEFFRGPFQHCLVGQADLLDTLRPYLARWGWKQSVHDLVHLWMESENRPRHDVLDLVARVTGPDDVCCLASNQEKTRGEYIANAMGFASRFHRLYFSHEVGAAKPSAEFYRAIESDLGVEPSRIYFWDDSPGHVEAAAALGWNAYVFRGRESVVDVL